MKSKTILGISFTTVFAFSIISAVTAIQADEMFKLRHLPEFKKANFKHLETINSDISIEKIDQSFYTENNMLENSVLNNQLKN